MKNTLGFVQELDVMKGEIMREYRDAALEREVNKRLGIHEPIIWFTHGKGYSLGENGKKYKSREEAIIYG